MVQSLKNPLLFASDTNFPLILPAANIHNYIRIQKSYIINVSSPQSVIDRITASTCTYSRYIPLAPFRRGMFYSQEALVAGKDIQPVLNLLLHRNVLTHLEVEGVVSASLKSKSRCRNFHAKRSTIFYRHIQERTRTIST